LTPMWGWGMVLGVEKTLTTPEGLAAYMRQTVDADDWNRRAAEVLRVNGDKYPSFWWETVMASGLYHEVVGGGISIVNLDSDGNEIGRTTYDPVTGQELLPGN